MINPTLITEQLLFSTIKLSTSSGSGTGFFFTFKVNDLYYPVIITNRHVVGYKNKEMVNFLLHIKQENKPSDENIEINFDTE
jgi:hypothetical protein